MGNPNPKPPVQPDNLSERFAVQAEINQSLKRINALQDRATLVRSPESPAANAIRRAKRPVGKNETFYQRKQRVDALFTAAISSEDIIEFVQVLVCKAKNGDLDAIRIILDRLAGKPQAAIDLTSAGERVGDTSVELILDVSQGPGMAAAIAEGDATRVLPLESGNADTAKSSATAVAAIAPSAK
jgi:hypothetical protein